MKKIIIYSPTDSMIIDEKSPKGGADITLLKMIEVLSKEHNVTALIPIKETMQIGKAVCEPFNKPMIDLDCDILILYRKVRRISFINAKQKIFYSQDTVDTPCFKGATDYYSFKYFDKVIVLSQYHKDNFQTRYRHDNIIILGNAT